VIWSIAIRPYCGDFEIPERKCGYRLQQHITHKTRKKKQMEFRHFRVFRRQIEK